MLHTFVTVTVHGYTQSDRSLRKIMITKKSNGYLIKEKSII